MNSPADLLFDDAPRPPLTRRQIAAGLGIVLSIYVATRLLVWTFAYAGALLNLRIELQLSPPFDQHEKPLAARLADRDSREFVLFQERFANLRPLLNFDGLHYRSIVQRGYKYQPVSTQAEPNERQQNIAFFPLYPLLCRVFAPLLGVHAAMIFVSHAAALTAAMVLYFWLARRIDPPAAGYAVACVFCLPPACYYSFGYAESTTLLFTCLTLMCLDSGRWTAAAIACGIASATRPTAASLVLVFVLTFWQRLAPAKALSRAVRLAPRAALAGLGIAAYALYLTMRFGSPLVYFTNFRVGWVPDQHRADWLQYATLARVWDQFKYFGRALGGVPESLVTLIKPFAWNMPICLGLVALSLLALRVTPPRFRPLLWLGPFIFLQSYFASGGATFGVEPIARYMCVATPALIVLGVWMSRRWSSGARSGVLGTMLVLQAAWALHFGLGEWSG